MNRLFIPNELNNLFGPVSADIRKRLSQVHRDPKKFWDRDHGIILRADIGHLTLWQAILRVDPTFPHTGKSTDAKGRVVKDWPRYPTPELIERALLYAAPQQGRVF